MRITEWKKKCHHGWERKRANGKFHSVLESSCVHLTIVGRKKAFQPVTSWEVVKSFKAFFSPSLWWRCRDFLINISINESNELVYSTKLLQLSRSIWRSLCNHFKSFHLVMFIFRTPQNTWTYLCGACVEVDWLDFYVISRNSIFWPQFHFPSPTPEQISTNFLHLRTIPTLTDYTRKWIAMQDFFLSPTIHFAILWERVSMLSWIAKGEQKFSYPMNWFAFFISLFFAPTRALTNHNIAETDHKTLIIKLNGYHGRVIGVWSIL